MYVYIYIYTVDTSGVNRLAGQICHNRHFRKKLQQNLLHMILTEVLSLATHNTIRRSSKIQASRGYSAPAVHRQEPVVVVSDVPHGAVVGVAPASPLAESSQDELMVEAAGEGEPADADEPVEGGEVAEGVDAGGAAEQTEDEAVSALAMEDPTSFATAFAEAVAACGLETDDSKITTPAAGVDTDDTKWDKYPLGQLPDENDPDFSSDTMASLRSMGGTLADLFDVGVVGELASMTSIGAIVKYKCTG
jgi:hypothetical protein